jgi:hypothetical protein
MMWASAMVIFAAVTPQDVLTTEELTDDKFGVSPPTAARTANCTECSACSAGSRHAHAPVNGTCPINCHPVFNYDGEGTSSRAVQTAIPLLALAMFFAFACCAVFRTSQVLS